MKFSASTEAQLEACKIDSGSNFLAGSSCSSFDPNFSKDTAGISNVTQSAVGVTAGAANLVGQSLNTANISALVVTEGIAYIQSSVMSYMSQCAVQLMTFPTAYVAQVTQAKIKDGMADMMTRVNDKLNKDAEEAAKKEEEKNKKKADEDAKKKSNEKVQAMSYTASTAMNKANEQLGKISSYVSKGPAWMGNQVDKCAYTIMKQTEGSMGKIVNDFEITKMSMAYSMASTAADIILSETFETTLTNMKLAQQKIERLKKAAITKAKALASAAIMKIKGLLGG